MNSENSGDPTRGLGLYLLLFFLVWTVRVTLFYSIDQSISSPVLGQVYADLVRVLIWVIPVLICVAWIDKKDPLNYLLLKKTGERHALSQSILIILLYLAVSVLIDSMLAGHRPNIDIQPLSGSWLKTFLAVTIAPIAEEILYRGFILQKLQARFSSLKANLITSALFVAIHWPNWLYTGKSPAEMGMVSLQIFGLSLLLGYLVQKTKSLWPSIVCHMLNNMISFFVV